MILSNYLLSVFRGKSKSSDGGSDPPINNSDFREDWLHQFRNILSRSKAVGANVVIVLPLPDFQATRKGSDMRPCVKQWYRPILKEDCLMKASRNALANEIRPIAKWFSSEQQHYPNLYIYDPFELFCEKDAEYCKNYKGSKRVYLDDDHLNVYGARILAPDFARFLKVNHLLGAPG